MYATRYFESLLGADEIGDYHAAAQAGYDCLMGSYGFDTRDRLLIRGEVPPACIYDSPALLAEALSMRLEIYAGRGEQVLIEQVYGTAISAGAISASGIGAR